MAESAATEKFLKLKVQLADQKSKKEESVGMMKPMAEPPCKPTLEMAALDAGAVGPPQPQKHRPTAAPTVAVPSQARLQHPWPQTATAGAVNADIEEQAVPSLLRAVALVMEMMRRKNSEQ
jgi:hypothetical protein